MAISIYDMDKTITRRPSWLPWLIFYARTEAPWRLLLLPLMLWPTLGYALKLLDRKALKEATQRLMMGARARKAKVDRAAVAFAETFGAAEELPEALEAIAQDRAAGREVVLATASSRFYAEALAARWGISRVIATENWWEGDALTPRIRGENCYGMAKLGMILAALAGRPPEVRFVSDHESDLPALLWADAPLCANPSPALRREAAARGWPLAFWATDG